MNEMAIQDQKYEPQYQVVPLWWSRASFLALCTMLVICILLSCITYYNETRIDKLEKKTNASKPT